MTITDATTIAELAEILRRNGGRLRSLILDLDRRHPENTRACALYNGPNGCASASAFVDNGTLAAAISAALKKAGAK